MPSFSLVPALDVAIIGAGHLGALVHDCLADDDRWNCTAFHDDAKAGGSLHGLPIFGTGVEALAPGQRVIAALGRPAERRAFVERFAQRDLDWQTFVDRRSVVGQGAVIGRGVVILNFAMVASGVTIGPFCYLSPYCHVGTTSRVGAYTSVLGGASIGESIIGEECQIGLKSICIENAVLGDRVTVAPMTLVRRSVPDDALIAGAPARISLRNRI